MSAVDTSLVFTAQHAYLRARFDGAIRVNQVDEPSKAFSYDITFFLDSPPFKEQLASQKKPPKHFHSHQEEYLRVVHGVLGVEVEAKEYILTPRNGEFVIRPWSNHRLYAVHGDRPSSEQDCGSESEHSTTRFLLSGQECEANFQLDSLFFQNWYGYQDEVTANHGKFDLIQVMNMFDAGGSYLSFPTWIPFSRGLARLAGIVVGRWLGGLLGYQPFHRRWTKDWSLAASKMERHGFASAMRRAMPWIRKKAD